MSPGARAPVDAAIGEIERRAAADRARRNRRRRRTPSHSARRAGPSPLHQRLGEVHVAFAVGARARQLFVVLRDQRQRRRSPIGRAVRSERTTTSSPVAPEKLCSAMSV